MQLHVAFAELCWPLSWQPIVHDSPVYLLSQQTTVLSANVHVLQLFVFHLFLIILNDNNIIRLNTKTPFSLVFDPDRIQIEYLVQC